MEVHSLLAEHPIRPAERRPAALLEVPIRLAERRPADPSRRPAVRAGHPEVRRRHPAERHLEVPIPREEVPPEVPIPPVDVHPAVRRPEAPIHPEARHPEAVHPEARHPEVHLEARRPEVPSHPAAHPAAHLEDRPEARRHLEDPIHPVVHHLAGPIHPAVHQEGARVHRAAARIRLHGRSPSFEHPPWSAVGAAQTNQSPNAYPIVGDKATPESGNSAMIFTSAVTPCPAPPVGIMAPNPPPANALPL